MRTVRDYCRLVSEKTNGIVRRNSVIFILSVVFGFLLFVVLFPSNQTQETARPIKAHPQQKQKKTAKKEPIVEKKVVEIDPTQTKTYQDDELGIAFEYFPDWYVSNRYSDITNYYEGLVTFTSEFLFPDLKLCEKDTVFPPCIESYANPEGVDVEINGWKAKRYSVDASAEEVIGLTVYQTIEEPFFEIVFPLEDAGTFFQQQRILSSLRQTTQEIEFNPRNVNTWKEISNHKLGIKIKHPPDILWPYNSPDEGEISLHHSGPRQAGGTGSYNGYSIKLSRLSMPGKTLEQALEEDMSQRPWGYGSETTNDYRFEYIFQDKQRGVVLTSLFGRPISDNGYYLIEIPNPGEFLLILVWVNDYGEETDFQYLVDQIVQSIRFI